MTLKRCVFVESNTTGTGEILLHKALAAGYDVVFLSATPGKFRFLENQRVHVIVVDTQDVEAVYRVVSNLRGVACLMSTSEYFITVCAHVCLRLGLPANSVDAITCCRDKFALATRLQAADIATPASVCLSPKAPFKQAHIDKTISASVNFPCVVKPLSASGSIGVQRIETRQQLDNYLRHTQETHILCQDYIEGDEYSVECFSIGGQHSIIGITRKHLGEWPYFVETGHDFPAKLNADLHAHIERCAQDALNAVGFRYGPAHIELRVSQGQAWIIEINPRLAGGMIPALIKLAGEHDPLDLLFDLYRGEFAHWMRDDNTLRFNAPSRYTSIRFLLAQQLGNISELHVTQQTEAITLIKQPGDPITCLSDFSVRIAHAIASADTLDSAAQQATQLLTQIQWAITPTPKASSEAPQTQEAQENQETSTALAERITQRLNNTGRLASALDPRAQAILHETSPLSNNTHCDSELSIITQIDEAHILMLHQQGLLNTASAQALLTCIGTLQQQQFATLNAMQHPRGIYLSYEAYLCETLGDAIGGLLQLGRSRNDLNATVNTLQLRHRLHAFSKQCWHFTSVLIHTALQQQHTLLPIYSQYQTALPGTFAHYLTGIATDMLHTLQQLQHFDSTQFHCPLGAGAGGGSALAIDPQQSAHYLGLHSHHLHALTAVSSRASNLRVLGEVQQCALLLSRVAQDLQFMSSREVALITLPDTLCGGSSSMPQKKNPYLLEWVKANVNDITADYQALVSTLNKTPFSNAYEVSLMCAAKTESMFNRAYRVVGMMSLLIAGIRVDSHRSQYLIEHEFTWATYVTEWLASTQGQDFRSAHHHVGETIAAHLKTPLDTRGSPQAVFEHLTQKQLAYSADAIVEATRFGGGPSPHAVSQQLDALAESLHHLGECLETQDKQRKHSQHYRQIAIQALLGSE